MIVLLGFLMGAAVYCLGIASGLSLALWYMNRNRRGYQRYYPVIDRGEYAEVDVPTYNAITHAEE